jgi:hypothetical protein
MEALEEAVSDDVLKVEVKVKVLLRGIMCLFN